MTEKTTVNPDEWTSLDAAARTNLNGAYLAQFFRYRDTLRNDGHQWSGDAEAILMGYIWDASEGLD